MRTNYVLIDYENVQPNSFSGLEAEHFRVLVFVGASQNKLTFEVASAMQRLGARAEYVKIAGNGANALDFHIAFHIGRISAQDPSAFFHIISKDTGFDPLIAHLKERQVLAARVKDVAEIALLKPATSKTLSEKLATVVAKLRQQGTSKPRTVKALSSTVNALFQKQLSEEDVTTLLRALQIKGFVSMDDTKVIYSSLLSEA